MTLDEQLAYLTKGCVDVVRREFEGMLAQTQQTNDRAARYTAGSESD